MPYQSRMAQIVSGAAAMTVLMLAVPGGANAQQSNIGNGFLFGRPNASITLRGGFAEPTAKSDVFTFTREQLTVGKNAFAGLSGSANIDINLGNRFAVQVNGGYSGRSQASEFRNWVDNNDLPIEQTTTLRRVPIMAGLRYNLVNAGRSLGRLAWVPTRAVPYVAAGGGTVWYQFQQKGDFVDFKTNDVFSDELISQGWAPGAYGAFGLDVALHPAVGLNTEVRYDRSKSPMSLDFSGFDHIDLSGVAVTVGLTFRF